MCVCCQLRKKAQLVQTSHIGKNSHMVYSGSKESNEPVELTTMTSFAIWVWRRLTGSLFFFLFPFYGRWNSQLWFEPGVSWLEACFKSDRWRSCSSFLLCEEILVVENNFNLKCTLCKPLCAILWKSTNKKKYFLNDASSHGIQENGVHLWVDISASKETVLPLSSHVFSGNLPFHMI